MKLLSQFYRLALNVPVGVKILGIGLGMAALFGAATLGIVRSDLSWRLSKDLRASGRILAEDLSEHAERMVAVGDTLALHTLLADAKQRHEHLLYAMVLDKSGRVLAHTFEKRVPNDLVDFGMVPPDDTVMEYLESETERFWDVRAPISQGLGGQIRVGLSERIIDQALSGTTSTILATLGVCSAIGLVSTLLLTRALIRPIHGLVDVTERVGKGDLSVTVPVHSEDEIGKLARSLDEMIAKLRHYRREVQEKDAARTSLIRKIITAQENERKRIARELHDGTGQALTSILIHLRLVLDADSEGHNRESLQDLRNQVADTLEEIRNLALELRPAMLDDHGIVEALGKYAQEFSQRTGVPTDFQVTGFDASDSMPSHLESTLYRVAQEALTNVARHAQAHRASVVLHGTGDHIRLLVEDNGIGFDVDQAAHASTSPRRLGILGMRERAALVDGALAIESSKESGTSVRLEVPRPERRTP